MTLSFREDPIQTSSHANDPATYAITRAPLFNGISDEFKNALAAAATFLEMRSGQFITHPDPRQAALGENGLLITGDELLRVNGPWGTIPLNPGDSWGQRAWLNQGVGRAATTHALSSGSGWVISEPLASFRATALDAAIVRRNAAGITPLAANNSVATRAERRFRLPVVPPMEAHDFEPISAIANGLGLQSVDFQAQSSIPHQRGCILLLDKGCVLISSGGKKLAKVQGPGLIFEVAGSGGQASGEVQAIDQVSGKWIPLQDLFTNLGQISDDDLLVLMKIILREADRKLLLSNGLLATLANEVREGIEGTELLEMLRRAKAVYAAFLNAGRILLGKE